MAITSMTGFSRAEGSIDDSRWSWELKTVNGRGLDIRFRLPPGLDSLEAPARKAISGALARGQVTANLQLRGSARREALTVNEDLLHQLAETARRLTETGDIASPRADGLLALRGVLEVAEPELEEADLARSDGALLDGLKQAIAGLADMRAAEGAELTNVLSAQIGRIEKLAAAIAGAEENRPQAIRRRLSAKLDELLSERAELPEDRLAHEVALLVVKADISEELDRLNAHVASARSLVGSEGPVGRKLDFLAQEFNREANTICSKAVDIAVTNLGLELKAVIDQFREQVQNVE